MAAMKSEPPSAKGELPLPNKQHHNVTTSRSIPKSQSPQSDSSLRRCYKMLTWAFTHVLLPLICLALMIWWIIITQRSHVNIDQVYSVKLALDSVNTASEHSVYKEMDATKPTGPFGSLKGPHITENFPDPCVLVHEGTTYAFATNTRRAGADRIHVQIAISTDNTTWDLRPDLDALPTIAPWQTGNAVWAPDVKHLPNGQFLLYYTDSLITNPETHCIGAAVADSVTGPYTPCLTSLICPRGGSIDPAGFLDRSTGKRYIIYKIDGNSLGHGGLCRNDVLPIMPTPLMLQEVNANDGVTLIGSPTQLLDRDALDGPLIEAPAMYLTHQGVYFLFFSSHCFTTPLYHTTYATARNITGPYTRANRPLLITGDGDDHGLGIVGPGGLDIVQDSYATLTVEDIDGWTQGHTERDSKYDKEGHLVVFHGHMTPQNTLDMGKAQTPTQDLHLPFTRGMYSGKVHFRGTLASLRAEGFEENDDESADGHWNEL